MAVPKLPWVPEALDKGNTLRRPACVHWTGRDPAAWLSRHREQGSRILGVELADEAIRLADLSAARERIIVVLLGRTYGSFPVSICGLTCECMQDSGFWFWLREPGRDG
jgi:tRNA (guanosine-2'-O-)-methyltransferase